jgi:valyl-tRNA synthetase
MSTRRSTSEVGHAKNVANFSELIQLLEEMGPLYNPTNPAIETAALNTLRDNLAISIENLAYKIAPFKIAVANRENAFTDLSKKATRVRNSFKSMGLSTAENDNIATVVRKIRGDKAIRRVENLENAETESISNAQLSYTSRATNLQSLASLLSAYPAYAPNEIDLTTLKLSQFYDELKDLNNEAANKTFALITARKERNDLLYNNPGNLLSLVNPIKDYLKSVVGANAYYRAAVRLKFKTVE